MKLTNQQIEALVDAIYQKENKVFLPENKKRKEYALKKSEKEAKRLMAIYKTIPSSLRKAMYYSDNLTLDKLQGRIEERVNEKSPDRGKIRNKVLIASIDSKQFDELKKKLNIEF